MTARYFKSIGKLCASTWKRQTIRNCYQASGPTTATSEDMTSFRVILRGVPFSANKTDITNFLGADVVLANGVKSSVSIFDGNARVDLASQADMQRAMDRDGAYIGSRYIKVTPLEMKLVNNRSGMVANNGVIVKMVGLPYRTEQHAIEEFFSGLEIAEDGIQWATAPMAKRRGEVFVSFTSKDMAEQALSRDRMEIGNRHYVTNYVTKWVAGEHVMGNLTFGVHPYWNPDWRPGLDLTYVFGILYVTVVSGYTPYEMEDKFIQDGRYTSERRYPGEIGSDKKKLSQQPDASFTSKTGYGVHMHGLPYKATEDDVINFFAPLVPVEVQMQLLTHSGSPSGKCNVSFETHNEAVKALEKNKDVIGSRYIELFLISNGSS